MNIKDYFRKDNPFDYIVLGFIMKILGTFGSFFMSYYVPVAFFGIISWVLIFKGITKIPGKLKFPFSEKYVFLLKFYLALCLIMIIRGYLIDYPFLWISTIGCINYHIFDQSYWLCYLMPFTALIPIKYYNFRLIALYSSLFVLVTVFMAIIFRNEILLASFYGAVGLGEEARDMIHAQQVAFYGYFVFVPLLCMFLPSKKWRINMFGLFITILLNIIGGRRGGTMLSSILFVVSLYFYVLTKRKIVRVLFLIIIILCLVSIVYILLNSSIVDFIMQRGMEDNRSGVEEAMLNQMSPFELIFGKGLNGRYYYNIYLSHPEFDYLDGWRYTVETGFLHLVLKGGYLLAIIYVVLLAIPAYIGLFKSKNYFCKAGAFYICYSLFSLWPFGQLQFDLSFFFIWMMITCCMNREVRNMSNEDIRQKFFYNLK